ncbi:hypothetical protein MBLNU230_g0870t1 [Neophaeotheca triangularis]
MSVDIDTLRHEIKVWEKTFADANHGKKPTKQDIQRDASIAAKYNHYDFLRGRKAVRYAVQTPTKPAKRRSIENDREALRERPANAVDSTPKKETVKLDVQQPHRLSPVQEEEPEPTPAFIRHALGPTPQKDGQILGIFDLPGSATPSRKIGDTPSKPRAEVAGTPTKPSTSSPIQLNLTRTPQSSSKRFYLDAFAGTPLKRKREDDHGTPATAKRLFATPTFLRRSFPLAPVEEEEESTLRPRGKKQPMVRSLSSMIQNMRKQQEEQLDDEQDIMDEVEAEARGDSVPSKAASESFVEDSQGVEMPLGPDQGPPESDEEEADAGALDANGNPRKVWKKKGLKRQTRRVNMRPVLHKPRKEADELGAGEVSEEEEVVEETQRAELRPHGKKRMMAEGEGSGGEEEGSDYADEELASESELVAKGKAVKPKASEGAGKEKKKETEKFEAKEGPVKKAARKVSAQAHQNFRKLKIKQKNPKSGGRGGRFGKR